MAHISDIKLIRTDTTLDLSQKAEKGMNFYALKRAFYKNTSDDCYLYSSIRDLIVGGLTLNFKCPNVIALTCIFHNPSGVMLNPL